jgi:CRISPR-associated protein Csx17
MAVHVHELKGLKPDALATYLAALGVFRILAEQKDPEVRARWRDEHFVLVTTLDWPEIERFLLEDYAPTPILAPWNMESGFFSLKPAGDASAEASHTASDSDDAGEEQDEPTDEAEETENRDDEDDTEQAVGDPLLDQLQATTASRFLRVRDAIKLARKIIPKELHSAAEDVRRAKMRLKEAQEHKKVAQKEKKRIEQEVKEAERGAKEAKKRLKDVQSLTKERLIADLRAGWGAEGQQWVDAAVVLDDRSKKGFEFTSLFGSGGNDGRMEFTKNFRHHLNELFDLNSGNPKDGAGKKLCAALFGGPNNLLTPKAVGQFFPGRAGGANMGAGFEGGAAVNSWDFLLMLEGAVALVAGMSRRGEVGRARVSSPFWVEAAAAGFGSASEREQSPRGEQWLPLWSQPLGYCELVQLFREGRAQVGGRQATRASDLVRATARLGLARGIDSLQRFAYLQRNGQSNLAVFTGRFHVRSRSHQELLDDVAPWIDHLVARAKEKNVPTGLGVVARRAQDALFSVCRRKATAQDWRNLLIALGDAELALLRFGKNPGRRPLPPLQPGWIPAVDDATPDGRCALRLALAFASQHRPVEGKNEFCDPVRRHFLPMDDRGRFELDERGRPKLGPEQVCVGRDLVADAIALVERRSIWARSAKNERDRAPRLPLQAIPGCEVTLEEVGAWIRGDVSDGEVLDLVRPLLALDWTTVREQAAKGPLVEPAGDGVLEPLHLLFRLTYLPFDVPVTGADGRNEIPVAVRLDPEPLRQLAAGDPAP